MNWKCDRVSRLVFQNWIAFVEYRTKSGGCFKSSLVIPRNKSIHVAFNSGRAIDLATCDPRIQVAAWIAVVLPIAATHGACAQRNLMIQVSILYICNIEKIQILEDGNILWTYKIICNSYRISLTARSRSSWIVIGRYPVYPYTCLF